MVEIIALIPARSGSKGLPGKNTLTLLNKPLISHSIEFALNSTLFDGVFVSTDSYEIAAISNEYGAQVPFIRPRDLAEDDTPMSDVVAHFANWLSPKPLGETLVCLLDPTSPIREIEAIKRGIEKVRSGEFECAISISEPSFNPMWVGVQVGPGDKLSRHPSNDKVFASRQEAPPYFRINGNFYIWRHSDALNLTPNYLEYLKVFGTQIEDEIAYSIDTKSDFVRLEKLLNANILSITSEVNRSDQ